MKTKYALFVCLIAVITLGGLTACQADIETKTVTAVSPTYTLTETVTAIGHIFTVTRTVPAISWLDIPTYNEFWGTIRVSVGEEFAIALYRQPRLGLNWYENYNESLLVLSASGFKEYSTSFGGVNGDQYFIFKALEKHTTKIKFIYKQSFPEAEVIEEKTFIIDIQ